MRIVIVVPRYKVCDHVSRILSKSFDYQTSMWDFSRIICSVSQCGELAEKVSEIIDPHYVDVVDMSEVQVLITTDIFFSLMLVTYFGFFSSYVAGQDEFSAVITRSLVTLVLGIETKFDTEMAAMTRVPWGALDSVGDQSG